MLLLQQQIRFLVDHDLDCSEAAIRLMAMRTDMVDLIRQRNALGGLEISPDLAERPRQPYRPELRRRGLVAKEKPAKEKPGRSRVLTN